MLVLLRHCNILDVYVVTVDPLVYSYQFEIRIKPQKGYECYSKAIYPFTGYCLYCSFLCWLLLWAAEKGKDVTTEAKGKCKKANMAVSFTCQIFDRFCNVKEDQGTVLEDDNEATITNVREIILEK